MIVDWGAHLYPREVFPEEFYADNPLVDRLGPVFWDPAAAAERFAASRIDAAVLSQPLYMGHEDAAETARANDALLEVVEEHDQFYGLAAVPVAAGGTAAAEELERALAAGYHGGALPARAGGVGLIDEALEPVLEVADDAGAPLFVHPELHDSLHPGAFDDTYLLNAIFGREASLATSVCEVIHAGVLDRYPDVSLVYHHFGGNVAAMMGRIKLQLEAGRWPDRQDDVKPFEEFRAQFEERIHVDTAGFFAHHAPVRDALEVLPPEGLLLGTDHPFEPRDADELDAYVAAIEERVPQRTARRILGGNALDLLVDAG